ncbi:MAG: bifunctional phosphoribosylaminoimidazolecarboxamide formyltransferase/IMP cyclohydrolase [Bacteroidota bacterium]
MEKRINSALISVYKKDGLAPLIKLLSDLDVTMYSTGGTRDFIEQQGGECVPVEAVTGYPSILGGRVKTLHPKVFGGILARRDHQEDISQLTQYEIPTYDLVIVDLYPFEETVTSGAVESEIIEKIDIGGVSLLRAAAKNFTDVLVISDAADYTPLLNMLSKQKGVTTLAQRREMMAKTFEVTAHYDKMIGNYFSGKPLQVLRYGENPHQKGVFHGDLSKMLTQLNGKELSYNNLLDIEAAVNLIRDFSECSFAVIKHNNACGFATDADPLTAWKKALAGDPVSAFGGVIITNRNVDVTTASELSKLFFEVLIAPSFDIAALEILKEKKNRILLQHNEIPLPEIQYRTLLNGVLEQTRDVITETKNELKIVTDASPSPEQINDLLFANKLVKHSKSNSIILVKNQQLLGSGAGQTSRVDALKQAIEKANAFGFDLQGAVMASDAFFPFDDCVTIAAAAGIKSVIQPGGSVKDADSVNACNKLGVSMVFTGYRHFRH